MSDLEPVPAATVVIVRESTTHDDLEVLLLLRNSKLAFHGGHWVFPGGRIDPIDFEAAPDESEFNAARAAAVRETYEESGIVIHEPDLIHTAHWTTPPKLPRRFCTWFFVCVLTETVEVAVDNAEILDHRWISPAEALALANDDSFVLPRPTLVTLKDLAPHNRLQKLQSYLEKGDIRVFPNPSPYFTPRQSDVAGPE